MNLRPQALRTRLLVAASVILTVFVVLTGAVLERAFGKSGEQAQRDKLEGIVWNIIGALVTDETGRGYIDRGQAMDERLTAAVSSLQAAVFDEQGNAIWRSVPFSELRPPQAPKVNEWLYQRISDPDAFALSYGILVLDPKDDPRRFTIFVIEDATGFRAQLNIYRRAFWPWLAGASVLLATALIATLHWGLEPLRKLVGELRRIEMGDQFDIQSEYPDELKPLTQGLNAMIQNERNQQTRYRNALGDLAHSLKTPLAVAHALTEDAGLPTHLKQPLREQVQLMQQITGYQLRKAATAGRRTLAEPVLVRPMAEKLVGALTKVYADKQAAFELEIQAGVRFRADSGDLLELLGNLLDNAAKYGNGQVRLTARREARSNIVEVEDNGPGFPEGAEELVQRGMRADMKKPGQGIGLAAVYDLVRAYEGTLEMGHSDALGGARVTVRLPA